MTWYKHREKYIFFTRSQNDSEVSEQSYTPTVTFSKTKLIVHIYKRSFFLSHNCEPLQGLLGNTTHTKYLNHNSKGTILRLFPNVRITLLFFYTAKLKGFFSPFTAHKMLAFIRHPGQYFSKDLLQCLT